MFGAIPVEKGGAARISRFPPLCSVREVIVPVPVAGSNPKGHACTSVPVRGTVLKRARRLGSEGQPNVDRPLGCPDSRASRQARYPQEGGFSYFGDESFSVLLAHKAIYYSQPEGGICS